MASELVPTHATRKNKDAARVVPNFIFPRVGKAGGILQGLKARLIPCHLGRG